jgi:hypothetical protein
MTMYALLLLALLAVCALAVYLFFGRLSQFPCRTIRDVPAFLQPVDSMNLMELLDPQTESVLHSSMTETALRCEQQRSLHYVREYMKRMAHNANVLLEWSNAELNRTMVGKQVEDDSPEYIEAARKLHAAATEFRLYALLSLIKIQLWLVFRTRTWLPFAPPSLAELRQVCGMRFHALYSNLTDAASSLGQYYGVEFREELSRAWAAAA